MHPEELNIAQALQKARIDPSITIDDEDREKVEEQIKANNQAMIEQAKLFESLFGRGNGKKFYQMLRDQVLDTPLTDFAGNIAVSQIGIQMTSGEYLAFRAGQHSVVHWIEANMKFAKEIGNG